MQAEKAGEEKEQIELKEEGAEEKDDSKETEKDKKKKKKEKKEKKPKVPKEKKPKGPNCIDTLSAGLNLADRDEKAINTDVSVSQHILLQIKAYMWRLTL